MVCCWPSQGRLKRIRSFDKFGMAHRCLSQWLCGAVLHIGKASEMTAHALGGTSLVSAPKSNLLSSWHLGYIR